jgi:hypothetical protein
MADSEHIQIELRISTGDAVQEKLPYLDTSPTLYTDQYQG